MDLRVVGASFTVRALHCCLRGVSFCDSEVLFSVEVFFFLVRVVGTQGPVYQGCGMVLICIEPDSLGDASGKFFLVLASVNVVLLIVVGVMCAPLC